MTTLAQNTQNINVTPVRLEADHYQVPSFTDANTIYDLTFNYDRKYWQCNCPDATHRSNINCKHVGVLRAYIKKEKASKPEPEQKHSSSTELVQVLTRISSLEHAQDRTDGTFENIDHALCTKADQLGILQGRLTGREYQIDKQQKDINLQRELIGNLQTSVCRLNELTITQDETIKKLLATLDQQGNFIQEMHLQAQEQKRMLDDQAQQIDRLHDQISSQQKPVEQVVKIVVEQPQLAPRQVREATPRQAAESMAVTRVSKTECKSGKHTVPVVGNSAAGCSCAKGTRGQQCDHMIEVDKFLSRK